MEKQLKTVSEKIYENEKRAVDLEQALSVAGLGRYNLYYCLVLALFLISAITEPVGYAYVLPAAKCDLDMSDAMRGFLASLPYIGIVLTSYPWGYLVDTKGRKKIVIISAFGAGTFGILSGFMPELISFTICKFLTALCLAGPAAAPYSFIGEIIPQRYRDVTLSVTNGLQVCGAGLVPLMAWGIIPLDFRIDIFGAYYFRSWQLLTIANAAFFVAAALLMTCGPESPKYLVTQGKHDEAIAVLQTIYAKNKGKSRNEYPVKRLIMPDNDQGQKKTFLNSLKVQTMPLLLPPYLKWLALNGFLFFGLFATLNGLYVWVPDIINRIFSGDSQGMTACDVIEQRLNETAAVGECNDVIDPMTFIINAVASWSCALVVIVASTTVKIFGKKPLLVSVFVLVGVFCILINFITKELVFVVLASSMMLLGAGIGPLNAYAVDIFPTQLRGMAISLAMMIGRCGSVTGANVAGLLLNSACEATFYLFGGFLLVCGLLALLLLPKPQTPPSPLDSNKESTRL